MRRAARHALLALAAVVLPTAARAQHASARDAGAAVTALLDTLVPAQMARWHVPGGAVAVVLRDTLLAAGGWGVADAARGTPVDAARTLFQVGSVGKLLTWTAVMQLAAEGRLDLDADVNRYLPEEMQVPATFAEPVTLRRLATHTAGFEDRAAGLVVHDARRLGPRGVGSLRAVLRAGMPARVRPPGEVTAYSNHGAVLAGLVVERVTGVPLDRWVSARLLEPLGMRRTTHEQPYPAPLAAFAAPGHRPADGRMLPAPAEWLTASAVGIAGTTVTDLATFARAHLGDGAIVGEHGDSVRVLPADAAREMHRRQFANDARVSGMAFGWYERSLGGHRLLVHAGETSWSRALLAIVPEAKLAVVLAFNAPGGGMVRDSVLVAVLDCLLPSRAPAETTVAVERAVLERLEGAYLTTRRPHRGLEWLRIHFDPFYRPLVVRAARDTAGTLEIVQPPARAAAPRGYRPMRWLAVEPTRFRRADGLDVAAFHDDSLGRRWLVLDGTAPRAYERLAWYERLWLSPAMPLGAAALLVAALLVAVGRRLVSAARAAAAAR